MSEWWRREADLSFKNKHWEHVPWFEKGILEPIKDHYAHLSHNVIMFFESAKHGEKWAFTTMRPGRYLARYYPHLDNEAIKKLVAELEGGIELKFAVTEDEVVSVYENGPQSCMSYARSGFKQTGGIHPAAVYGNSDLQVAYLVNKDRITARALVWPEKKRFGRLYGDSLRLKNRLEEMGFIHKKLNGAKIRALKSVDNRIICPYIDMNKYVRPSRDNKNLIISSAGSKFKIFAQNTDGLADGIFCSECDTPTTAWQNFKKLGKLCYACMNKHCWICTYSRFAFENSEPYFEAMVSGDKGPRLGRVHQKYRAKFMECAVSGHLVQALHTVVHQGKRMAVWEYRKLTTQK